MGMAKCGLSVAPKLWMDFDDTWNI